MAQSPNYKVYRGNEYIASVKYAEDAAAIMAVGGDHTVKYQHAFTVYDTTKDPDPGESFDAVAALIYKRMRVKNAENFAKSPAGKSLGAGMN